MLSGNKKQAKQTDYNWFLIQPVAYVDRTGICLGIDVMIFAYYFSIDNSFAPYSDVQLVI